MQRNLKVPLYRILVRPVALREYETWILPKSERYKLLIFERQMLRRIFGFYRDESMGEWRIQKSEYNKKNK